MSKPDQLITEHLDIWTSAILAKSTVGRGSSKKYELYGIKKLRELILELAVRGKLVAQDPNDEPASVLLEKIEIIKQGLIKDKKIKRPKKLADVSDNEYYFEIPQGWHWARLNSIGEWGAGATPSRSNSEYYGGGIPWFKSGELSEDYISVSQETITELALKETSLRENKSGDVLLAMYGATIGKASILEVASSTNQAVCACTPFSGISNTFLLMLLKAYRSRFIGMGAGGAQPNISREKIIATVIALPPKEEQHRIVAKVDELMLLCDQLEQQTEASIDAHATLVDVLLAALTDSTDANDLAQNWARVSEHFESLFTTEQSIEALKQIVLQLAVMGKLVPQNPEDEPASVLIEKIVAKKDRLVKEGKVKYSKPTAAILDNEKYFELPQRWEWSKVGIYTHVFAGSSFKSGDFNTESGTKVIKITNAGVGNFLETEDYLPESFAMQYDSFLVNEGDLVLALTRPYISAGLKVSVCPPSYNNSLLNQRVAAIKSIVKSGYVYIFLRSPLVLAHYQAMFSGNGLQPNLKMSDILSLIIAVPPLAEQHRIVAKVDELMKICDQLKAQLQQSQITQIQLTDALIEKALV